MSLMLPAAEEFIVRTLEDVTAAHVLPERLRDEIEALRTDERRHQVAHDRYNARLASQGVDTGRITALVASWVHLLQAKPLAERALLVATFEQCTALLSAEILKRDAWLAGSESTSARMWRWHCEEEIEHHEAALRMADRFGWSRTTWFVAVVLSASMLFVDSIRLQQMLLADDLRKRRVTRWGAWFGNARFFTAVAPSAAIVGLCCLRVALVRRGETNGRWG